MGGVTLADVLTEQFAIEGFSPARAGLLFERSRAG